MSGKGVAILLGNGRQRKCFDHYLMLQDVLGGVVDGVIPLDDDSVGVVKDALAILACKEIKLSSLRRYDKLAASMRAILFCIT